MRVATEFLENRLKVNGEEAKTKLDNARRDLLSIPNRERPPRMQDTMATLNGRTSSTDDLTASSPLSRRRANGATTATGTRRLAGSQRSPTLDRRRTEKGVHFVNPLSFVPPSFAATAPATATVPAGHSAPSKRGLKEAQAQRLPWSEDFQVLRNNNRHSEGDEPQKAPRTASDGFVRIGGSEMRIEGRGRLAEPAAHSEQPRISNLRRRAAAKVENGLSSRNFEPDAKRIVVDRLCCPKNDVLTQQEGDLNAIRDRNATTSASSEKAKLALVIIPRPVCEIILAPLELSCLLRREPSLEARPEALALAPSPGGHRRPLVANAAMKQYAWMNLQPLEPREEELCRCTVATCGETLEAPDTTPAVHVIFNKPAGELEGSESPDGISSLDVENSKSLEEDDGDSDWEYYDDDDDEEEEEVAKAAAAPKSKPIMGRIPASLLTRWNWNYNNTDEESESEEESGDEVDEMSPHNTYEVRPTDSKARLWLEFNLL